MRKDKKPKLKEKKQIKKDPIDSFKQVVDLKSYNFVATVNIVLERIIKIT